MKLLLNYRARYFSALLILVAPSLATAIDLSTAVSKTLATNPTLQLYPYHVRALEGNELQAGLKPNPTLHVDLENAFGTGHTRFLSGYELTLSLSQVIELGKKREKRINVAKGNSLTLQREYKVKRLDVTANVLRDYYQALRLQHLLIWNNHRIEIEEAALDVIKRRANAGVVGKADVIRMQLRLAKSEAKKSELEFQHSNALNMLASNWSGTADFENVDGDLSQTPLAPNMAALLTAVQTTPDYLLLEAQTRVSEAHLALAQAESQANITVGAGIRRLETNNDNAFIFNFSMPLQWNNQNQGNIAAAYSTHQARLANQDLLKTQLEVVMKRITSAMENNIQQLELVENKIRPVANSLLDEVERGYQHGLYNVLQWVDAQDELFNIERERIEAQHALHLQYLELERLSGTDLASLSAY
ncbi:divalent cation transporter [Methylophaga marina]|uniref:TolC family protein n=1 Tax=Methylophaga marina TaxID=45495 RepID=A0ABN0TPT8_9GAMM|nr:TolC family protein [Methylophaga marina]BDZ74376.1 divalent cation transporter [Methylophaga marina]